MRRRRWPVEVDGCVMVYSERERALFEHGRRMGFVRGLATRTLREQQFDFYKDLWRGTK